jgi:hypothetical protein
MSLPSLLDALAGRVLGSSVAESSRLRLKRHFVERVIHGSSDYGTHATIENDAIDSIIALEGMALSWNLTERFDHATALRLLLERIQTSTSIPNGLHYHLPQQQFGRNPSNSEICFTEQKLVLQFLYRLYTFKHHNVGASSLSFNPKAHKLTPYVELLLKHQDWGPNGERKDVGWYFASTASVSSSSSQHSNQTELSINDTTFDALWGALLSPQSPELQPNGPQLKHPIFSVPLRHDVRLPLDQTSQHRLLEFQQDDPTHIHKAEGLGSMFGMLRFAHPSVLPKWFGPGSNSSEGSITFPKIRLDIDGDAEHRLELPELKNVEELENLPPWLQIQKWKPQSLLDTVSIPSSDPKSKEERVRDFPLPLVEGRKVTVADWLERTWHGAAGNVAPWKAPKTEGGVSIEEEVLEWKDRLIYRARLLNVVSETIGEALASYLEYIKGLFGGSYPTATAFCNSIRRFINFWRGELLFAAQKPPKKYDSVERLLGPSILDDVLPPAFLLDSLGHDHLTEKGNPHSGPLKSDSEDFMKSFCRIVSTTGSCTQIVHLYHLVGQILQITDSGTDYPTGVEPINKLTQLCIHTEMDPIITFGISRQILSQTLVPFGRFFSEWLFWGALPTHADWMIEETKTTPFRQSPPLSPASTPHNAQMDRSNSVPTRDARPKHWLERFTIKFSHIPSFMRHYEQLVLKTGVLVQIYRDLQSKSQSKFNQTQDSDRSTLPMLRPIWCLSQLEKYYDGIRQYIGARSEEHQENWGELEWLEGTGNSAIVSVEQSLHDSFVVPLQIQFSQVSPAVCHGLVTDWALLSVFERLKSDYFGNLVSAAFDALPLGVDLLDESASSHSLERLRVIFCENIQGTLQKMGYRLALEKVPTCTGIDVLDNIVIEPTYIDWPLSIMITEHQLEQYNAVFVLLTKMTRTRAALNSIWTNLGSATRLAHRIRLASKKAKARAQMRESIFEIDWESTFQVLHKASLFCHQLQHFWTQLYHFIANQVGNTCFFQLQQSVKSAVHFEELVDAHEQFVASIMKSSLLAPNFRALMVVIEKTIHLVHKFRQQIRHSLADPSKWETRMRKAPIATKMTDLNATLGFISSASSSVSLASEPVSSKSLNESVFEQADYQPDHLDGLIQATRKDFDKCMKFLMAVLLKLLSRGYEPHMASLVASLNWNKFYFAGTEVHISEELH